MARDRDDSPNTIPWPPMLLASAVVASLLLEREVMATSFGGEGGALRFLGLAFAAIGLTLDLWTAWTFRRAKTTIMPHRGASRLVTGGPFRYSRNPIYLGNTLLLVGLGFAFDNVWLAGLAIAAAVATQKLAIEREERYLEAKFGEEWRAYAARVRRWI